MRTLGLPSAALLALALFVGGAAGAEYTVVIDRMRFGPVPSGLHPGDTIIWRNDDILRHTATARDDSFDVDLPAGEAVSMVVGAAGTFEFFCRFHPGMTGTLEVEP
jgi:Plastocyanin